MMRASRTRRRSTRQRSIEERRALQGYVLSLPRAEYVAYVGEDREFCSTDGQPLPDYDYVMCKRLFGDDTDAGTAWLQARILKRNLRLIAEGNAATRAANPTDWVGIIVATVVGNTMKFGLVLAALYPILPAPQMALAAFIAAIMAGFKFLEALIARAPR